MNRFELREYRVGSIPALLWQKEEERDGPFILVLHGLGDSRLGGYPVWLSYSLAQAGFRALAIDARFHGARADPGILAGSSQLFLSCIEETAQDLAKILDYFQVEKAGAVGFSLGGYIGYWAAAKDPRLKVLATIGAAPDFSALPSVAQGLGLSIDDKLKARIDALNPVVKLRSSYGLQILILAGEADEYLPVQGLTAAQHILGGATERIRVVRYPGVGHEITLEMVDEVISFLKRWI